MKHIWFLLPLVAFFFTTEVILAQGVKAQVSIFVTSGKEKEIKGIIAEENLQGIRLLGKSEVIEAADIRDVDYVNQLPFANRGVYRQGSEAEEKAAKAVSRDERDKLLDEAMSKYQESLDKMAVDLYAARRHMEFKLAFLKGQEGKGSQAQLPRVDGIKRLSTFKTKYPDSWQYPQVMMMIADLQKEQGSLEAAREALKELLGKAVSKKIKQQAQVRMVRLTMASGKYQDALAELDSLVKSLPAGSPQQLRLKLTEAECLMATEKYDAAVVALQKLLKEAKEEKDLITLAYNALGECYYKADRLQEARWPFLWVDVIYSQDREQHAKALYYLFHIFNRLSDFERAQEFQNTLLTSPEFAGTAFQRKALEEKKKG